MVKEIFELLGNKEKYEREEVEEIVSLIYGKYLIELSESVNPTTIEVLHNRINNENIGVSYARLPLFSFTIENTGDSPITLPKGAKLTNGTELFFLTSPTTILEGNRVKAKCKKGFMATIEAKEKELNLRVGYNEFESIETDVNYKLLLDDGMRILLKKPSRVTITSYRYRKGFESTPTRLRVLNVDGIIINEIKLVEPFLPPLTQEQMKELLLFQKDAEYVNVDRLLLGLGIRTFKYWREEGILKLMYSYPINRDDEVRNSLLTIGVNELEFVEPNETNVGVSISYEVLDESLSFTDIDLDILAKEVLAPLFADIPKEITLVKKLIKKRKGVYFKVEIEKVKYAKPTFFRMFFSNTVSSK